MDSDDLFPSAASIGEWIARVEVDAEKSMNARIAAGLAEMEKTGARSTRDLRDAHSRKILEDKMKAEFKARIAEMELQAKAEMEKRREEFRREEERKRIESEIKDYGLWG